MTTLYHKKGLPDDLLTSTTEGEREVKVSLIASDDLALFLAQTLAQSIEQNQEIINQLKLLNIRFEEMANTKLNLEDIGN